MRIDYKRLEGMGFHVETVQDGVDIYPRRTKDIATELQVLCELPLHDCYYLQEEIVEMQILNALRSPK